MKKIYKYSKILVLLGVIFTLGACEEFLNRPTEDSFTIDGFYQTDEQCFQAANVLYAAPWFDFQRGWIDIGDVLAGNVYKGTENEYLNLNITSANESLISASNSLWLVNGHCNAVIENIRDKAGSDVSQATKNTVTGEAMTLKALAYFFLARGWGDIPIIHSNSKIIGEGTANTLKKIKMNDVYEYITKTLIKATELLPEENEPGRINKYAAYGLLAKVYLTRSGVDSPDGTRNQSDLDNAAKYAKIVIEESGVSLEPVYANLFRISTGNRNPENLISWQWVVSDQWCSQNAIQADLALDNFTGHGDGWGSWSGPSIDLQEVFNEDARDERNNIDVRRKATMMMRGDYYPNFWRHEGGYTCTWDTETSQSGSNFGSGSGAAYVKHIVGHFKDHTDEAGYPSEFMKTSLATHILRLADVYLVYAEAILGNDASTSDPAALSAYNAVRKRAIATHVDVTSITFEDIFNERRKELALEGDNWFDFVRLSYYNPELAKQWINQQERGYFNGLDSYYKEEIPKEECTIESYKLNITENKKFRIPFPDVDLALNKNLSDEVEPVDFDFSTIEY